MGSIESKSSIFLRGTYFGLQEKYYRDLSELTSSFKFMTTSSREQIWVDPAKTTAAIVTCGGITPGINCVIRSLVKCLEMYKVKKIIGVRMGMHGLSQSDDKYWSTLTVEDV